MYGLKLSVMIQKHTDNLSATLQTTNLCAADAQETARLVVDTITRTQNEQVATSFYEMVKIRADRLSLEEPSLPRNRKVPNRVNFLHGYKESASHHHENGSDFYRAQYFASIDNVTETIKNRFDHPDCQMYIHMDQTLLKGAVGLDTDRHINMLQTICKNEFNYIQLKSQLFTMSSSLKLKLQSNMPLTMNGLIKHIQELNPGKKALFSHVFQLAQYSLVMNASNAVSEQSFCVL